MKLLRTLLLVLCASFTYAQTTSYYLSAEGKSGSALRSELNGIISGNTAIPYSSTSNTDTWDVLKLSDANSSDPTDVNLIYSGASSNGAQEWNSGTGWTREHVWPQSLGGFSTSNGVGTDVHNLKPAIPSLNSLRSNLEYDFLGTAGNAVNYNGAATGCRYDGSLGVFEPRNDIKGDLARIILYMDLRYEGVGNDPDLSVQENLNSGGTTFGVLSTLLQWHQNDPVDAFESNRNEVIYNYQGNRNPFVDHPELAAHLYGSSTGISWNPSSTGSSTGGACGDLFFSEYGEGSSNNKYLELYNPTDSAISLAGYTLYLSGNGGSYTNTFTSTAVIDSNAVYVITNTSASATILAEADTAMPYPSVAHFNGDDAVILVNGTDTIDVIGVPGVDPGSDWPVGSGSTANNTLVRMIAIDQGSTDWSTGAAEWDVYSSNDWTFLGSHGSACHGAVPPPPTSFTATFRVNTANITVGPNGMYAGGGVLGGANALALTDIGGGIWEGSALLNGSNGGNFAFFNSPAHGSDWGTKEDISGLACADPANYNDRILPSFTQDTTLLFCFATCSIDGTCPAPPATYDVTFKVDMNDYAYSYGTVYISGDFNGWSGTANPLADADNDGVWTGTYPIGSDSIEFKYTLDDWDTDEGLTPGSSCTKTTNGYTNRFVAITGTTDLAKVCWESCSACPSAPAPTTPCSNLYFSEYGEGSSSNKYLEIYNPSNAPISLSGYTVYLSGNGGNFTNTFTSNVVIDSNDVFVIAHASADSAILAIADTALSGYSVAAFNGDDALILVNGTDTIDVIGVPGVDPGSNWPVGSGSTANNTLVRMIGIDQGSTDWTVGATEWDVYSSNDWTFIDSHSSNCHGATPPPPTSFTVTFRVNTANITVGPNGMYAGGGVLGGSDALALTDIGGGVWEGSALVNGSNGGNFAFFNSPAHGADWGTKENLAGLSCADAANYNDRMLTTFTQDTTLLFCFGSCETDGTCPTPATPNNITFSVDMNQYGGSTANGVFVNGDFNGWCGSCNAMDDSDGDGVWMVTLPLTQDSIEYKFTVDGWNDQESLTVGSSCTKTSGTFTNRFLAINGDTTVATVCWNSCSACTSTPPPSTACSELFFSEYAEGSSYNKYFEIYNPSNAPISLSGYTVYLSGNGGAFTNTFTSNVVIDSNDVFVIAHASADSAILAIADTALSGYSVAAFNGDDALILVNGTDTIDVIGVPGVDPGSNWPVGSGSTANNTLVRMIGIDQGSTDWTVGATEWDVYSSNDWTFIDSHSSNCHGATPPPPTSFTVTFRVNTANITVGPNGMYAGGGVLGGSDALALTDIGGGVWEGSTLVNGSNGGNFVFFNSPSHGADWGTKEVLSGLACADPANYDDRIMPTFTQDTTLLFCFGTCLTDGTCPAPPSTNDVTFSVDMNQYGGSTANGVFVNGDFNGWCGSCNAMDDSDGDGVWMVTLPLTQDSIEYKFTVDGWNDQESLTVGSSCTKTSGTFTNRFLAINGDTTVATVCWNSCSACTSTPPPSTACSELFFSEYAEGSSYNKYFEIYNPSNAPISLSGYTVYLSGNGGAFTNTFTSNVVIDSNDVFVIAHASADSAILAIADTALSGYSVAAFNGDDALILVNGTDTIDVIGVPGVDPGSNWPVGSGSTANNTLVRMIGIDQGSTDWTVGATEWDVYSSNDWTFIDSHSSNCHGATPPPPTSFTVTFRVNTANITVGPNGMYAGGGVLGGSDALALTDIGGGVWEGSALVNGSNGGNFAFFNSPAHGADWGTKENLAGLSCADAANYNDRRLTTFTQDTTLLFCFGSCETDGTCPTPATPNNITFSVDMNQYGGSTANGVFVNGDFNGWCGSCNAMDDSDGDGVWMVTLPLTQDSIEYKFTVDGWNDQESLTVGSSCTKTTGANTNRFLAINGDTTVATVCWNSCGSCAPTVPTGVTLDANGCVECDSLNVGDFFVLNGDSVEVVDRTRLLAIVAASGDLTKVCVSHVTDMKNALRGYVTNNYDIGHWDMSNVTNTNSMFFKNRVFNQDISSWDMSSVTNTIGMFTRCDSFNQDLNTWDMSQVTNMNRMFKDAISFDGAIGNWDVENAVRMSEMFSSATAFNQDLSDWCVRAFQYNPPINFALNATAYLPAHYPRWGNCPQDFDNVTTLATGAFMNSAGCVDCSALNIGDYFEIGGDTLLVVDRNMLDSLVLLHDDLSKVCVSNITDMKDALRGLRWFNTDIAYWDVSNVTDMSNMFFKTQIFNQDIGNWDVSSVTKMVSMFQVAKVFDQDISAWDVSNVQRFRAMFRNALAFNQNIGGWDVSSVLNDAQMSSMFRGSSSFNQDLTLWCVSNVATKPSGFDANSPLVASNLPLWGTCPTPGSMVGNNNPIIASDEANGDNAADQAEMQEIGLFPNPTTGKVKISPVVEGTYRIYNEVGRTIGEGQIKEAYDFSTQPRGIYMLMLQTENGTQYLKVVKQ